MIRSSEVTRDEFFVLYSTAIKGAPIENTEQEPLLMLKHFEPDYNPDMPDKA